MKAQRKGERGADGLFKTPRLSYEMGSFSKGYYEDEQVTCLKIYQTDLKPVFLLLYRHTGFITVAVMLVNKQVKFFRLDECLQAKTVDKRLLYTVVRANKNLDSVLTPSPEYTPENTEDGLITQTKQINKYTNQEE